MMCSHHTPQDVLEEQNLCTWIKRHTCIHSCILTCTSTYIHSVKDFLEKNMKNIDTHLTCIHVYIHTLIRSCTYMHKCYLHACIHTCALSHAYMLTLIRSFYIHTYINPTWMHANILATQHTCMHTYINPTYMHTYIHKSYIHACMHTYIHKSYIHAYIHTYINPTYMHTYTHT